MLMPIDQLLYIDKEKPMWLQSNTEKVIQTSAPKLASALRRAAAAHGGHEKRTVSSALPSGRTGMPSTSCTVRPEIRYRHEIGSPIPVANNALFSFDLI